MFSIARAINPSTSIFASSASTSASTGFVFGCFGVNTVQQSSYGKIDVSIVPILRAGLGMVDGMLTLIPAAKVGHIGLYRDEDTAKPIEYFCKLPKDISSRDVIIADIMLATGGAASEAINLVKKAGAGNIKFMCIIATEQGIKQVNAAHPDVQIYCAAVDPELNDQLYIVPGLGDAGDRMYGTK